MIDIWAGIHEEFNGKMIITKKKEAISNTHLNVYMSEELNRAENYTDGEVINKWLIPS